MGMTASKESELHRRLAQVESVAGFMRVHKVDEEQVQAFVVRCICRVEEDLLIVLANDVHLDTKLRRLDTIVEFLHDQNVQPNAIQEFVLRCVTRLETEIEDRQT